jgi:hypothetical protein
MSTNEKVSFHTGASWQCLRSACEYQAEGLPLPDRYDERVSLQCKLE